MVTKLRTAHGLQGLSRSADFTARHSRLAALAWSRTLSPKIFLRIEICGPDRPYLTIVDLPGLVHSKNKYQSASDISLIQRLVTRYMKQKRSIILAVVSAKNDYANQIVLKLARTADPDGMRTLGVITKPDTLNAGPELERSFLSLARNQEVTFRLGWHVLRNRDTERELWTLDERDADESYFLSSGAWASLAPECRGSTSLRAA
ncbi:interferon-induced GTP-binding protein Mx [Beauveria bassiana ARSEF 2860]|uniref:Interferon-induced GTP-binding protein Mx n=1 Tax=Beauveria bassiana (strain ARSEF 2860) TaxID=655819 RepID=J4UFQ0_BEAB2|nr:interferon-induced GTP-binding protein Mx [Beauveria bassiana ARSEF 2860]EJP61422.1 interferon-induced GTP-binding protein Mx [Beauveria bassiana ARSEF 2860]